MHKSDVFFKSEWHLKMMFLKAVFCLFKFFFSNAKVCKRKLKKQSFCYISNNFTAKHYKHQLLAAFYHH